MNDWTNDHFYHIKESFLLKFLNEYVWLPTAVLLVGSDDERKKRIADKLFKRFTNWCKPTIDVTSRDILSTITPSLLGGEGERSKDYCIFNLAGDIGSDYDFLFDICYALRDIRVTVSMLWLPENGSPLGNPIDEAILSRPDIVHAPNRLFIVDS